MDTYNPVNRVAEYTEEGKELLEEHPIAGVGIAFGVGVAAGLAIAAMLGEAPQQRSHWHVAHRLGEHLLDAMSSVLPDTITSSLRAR